MFAAMEAGQYEIAAELLKCADLAALFEAKPPREGCSGISSWRFYRSPCASDLREDRKMCAGFAKNSCFFVQVHDILEKINFFL